MGGIRLMKPEELERQYTRRSELCAAYPAGGERSGARAGLVRCGELMRQADIGRAFRLVRVWREMSQLQLAVRAGVTQGLISSIERGRHDPEPTTFAKIVEALDVTEQKIFDIAWGLETKVWEP